MNQWSNNFSDSINLFTGLIFNKKFWEKKNLFKDAFLLTKISFKENWISILTSHYDFMLLRHDKEKKFQKNTLFIMDLVISYYHLWYLNNSSHLMLLRYCLFFGWIEKVKYFVFSYSTKSNMLTSFNIVKMNLLLISLI